MLYYIQCKSSQLVNITQVIKNILSIILCYDAILTYSKIVCFLLQNGFSMNKRIFTVYMHLFSNRKIYVGLTSRKPKYRWNNGDGYNLQPYLYNAINKHGWNNIEHIIVAENLTKKEACQLEIDLIKYWDTTNPKNGYNCLVGGQLGTYNCSELTRLKMSKSAKRRIVSEETRKKISEANMGKKNGMYGHRYSEEEKIKIGNRSRGRKASEETKKKMSLSMLGIKNHMYKKEVSQETRNKLSLINSGKGNSMYGKTHSKEVREKISKANKGRKLSEKVKRNISKGQYKTVLQYDLEGNFIKEWEGMLLAEKELNINNIYLSCKGIQKTVGGFIWRYKDGI